jgi:hypothetical protein
MSHFRTRTMASFVMKYYYLDFQGSEVYLGQDSGDFHEKEPGLCILRGSSSVSFRLVDQGLENRQGSSVLATPWRLLIISCGKESPALIPDLSNGPEAYFWGINEELTGIRRSLRHLANRISSIAAPSVGTCAVESSVTIALV